MKIRRGKISDWENYISRNQTGYDRVVIMLAESIAGLVEEGRSLFRPFDEILAKSIIKAAKDCGIRTEKKDLADAMINEALEILNEFWSTGWILTEFQFKDLTLYHNFRVICVLK